jgi:tRNA modification GTPase
VSGKLNALLGRLQYVMDAARQGSLLRAGIHVVLAGRPNVGKSSLLNRLSGEEIAIVTEIPGTTRDVIRQTIEIEGVPMHIIDTAGVRESEDPVEKIGIPRTRGVIEKSDLILYLADSVTGLDEYDRAILADLPDLPKVIVYNKIDLTGVSPGVSKAEDDPCVYLSAKSGAGIDALKRNLLELISWHSLGEDQFTARQRHVAALAEARASLECALGAVQAEILAEDLRGAQIALSKITGEFSAEDLLGEIFSRFCIGK